MYSDYDDRTEADDAAAESAAYQEAEAILAGDVPADEETKERVRRWLAR